MINAFAAQLGPSVLEPRYPKPRFARKSRWSRDLSAKIQAKADALVSKAEVSTEVSKERADTERMVVDAGVQAVATLHLSQRNDIRQFRSLAERALGEASPNPAVALQTSQGLTSCRMWRQADPRQQVTSRWLPVGLPAEALNA